ncbi:MAG: 4'-phosphopantetheinyl transferase superfamily protein [Bdellovibrionaceae bacterium]|nr:4'-phosphopantetheinyl transferase superfamily protein [Pseudobdellovibrionaceae bacterium]
MKLKVRTPEEADQLSIIDFQEAIGCRFVVVQFAQTHDPVMTDRLKRRFLAELLGQKPTEIQWQKTENGKPYLENSKVHFSITHSDAYWAFAYSEDDEIGIDLEAWSDRDRLSKVALRVFQPHENESWSSLPSTEDQIRRMLTLWTRKEAYIKAKGSLLFREISQFDATQDSDAVKLWSQSEDGSFVMSCARLKS